MMKKIFYSILTLLLCFSSFGQTNTELQKMGDAAMINGQYTNAVYYYAFILYKLNKVKTPIMIHTRLQRPLRNLKRTSKEVYFLLLIQAEKKS